MQWVLTEAKHKHVTSNRYQFHHILKTLLF